MEFSFKSKNFSIATYTAYVQKPQRAVTSYNRIVF